MFYPPKMYLRDKYVAAPLVVCLVMLGFAWWNTVHHFRQTEETVFLHYNIIFGIDLIGEWWKGWIAAEFASGIFLFNSILSYFLYQRNKFLGRFTIGFTAAIIIAVYIGLSFIIGLNS